MLKYVNIIQKCLGDLEIPDDVFKELTKISDNGIVLDLRKRKPLGAYLLAINWLNTNIKEGDCFDCEYEIEDLI